jgi:DNA topoisomerase II
VSFVNSICTTRGGTHVEYIANQITKRVKEIIDKKNKKKILIKPQHIKHNLWVFVNTQVENPAFDSQTKETLNTKSNAFGSSIELSEAFMKGILDSGIVDLVMKVANAKEEAKMAKDLGPGRKKVRLLGVPKLDDANDAGGGKSKECTIILTEGDSAKSLALAGIEVVGRDKYGVFPLRGKFLNVREAPNKQISENPEIQNLCKILGLAPGKKYESVAELRYGRVLIMTDQDHDGSHIKGLLINFVHHMWPSLLRLNGFLDEFVTPIIKATKGERVKTFFTIPEYEQWAASVGTKGWKIKYYKGLGTSTTKEAKEYFAALEDHTIAFRYRGPEDDDAIELAFAKKKADARKEWLQTYTKDLFVDHSIKELRYKDFVNKELILFSVADCARSIPSICDGFKPGQRKIIYSSFKRKLTKEIKVAQFSGYVAEHSAYHHGEVSLQGSIVALAQNFVGSNNINYLMPNGQFGTRLMGGKDAASARYIHTELSPVTRTIFPEEDDAVLECLVDEGQRIEPHHYVPILPTVLVNGAEGIGTGWSTFIPQHDPRAIVDNIRRMMAGSELQRLAPWYKGYFGTIEPLEGGRYQVTGTYEVEPVPGGDDQVTITELPVGKWTRDYKTMLEEMAARDEILEIREQHAENRVHFELCVPGASRMSEAAFLKKFKLQTTMSTNNYVLFDDEGKIQRFGNELDIMKHWFDLRAELYNARKEHMLKKLDKECEILRNKVRFITAIITGELVVSRVKRAIILEKLRSAGYTPMSEIEKLLPRVNTAAILEVKEGTEKSEEQEPDDDDAVDLGGVSAKEYDYLLAMALWSLTDEKVEQLTKQLADKQQAYQELQGTHIYTLWGRDLDRFLAALTTHEEKEEADRLAHTAKQSGGAVG